MHIFKSRKGMTYTHEEKQLHGNEPRIMVFLWFITVLHLHLDNT